MIYVFFILLVSSLSYSLPNGKKVKLTFEEVELLIQEINKDSDLQMKVKPEIHSEKGLKQIVECVNDARLCKHPGILQHKIDNTDDFKDLYTTMPTVDDILIPVEDRILQRSRKANEQSIVEIFLFNKTQLFFYYLHGYSQKKKEDLNK